MIFMEARDLQRPVIPMNETTAEPAERLIDIDGWEGENFS